jgi:hypothetical protein
VGTICHTDVLGFHIKIETPIAAVPKEIGSDKLGELYEFLDDVAKRLQGFDGL